MAYIEFRHYTKVIHHRTVLQDVTLEMEQGRIYGVTGRNGSGKTMLLRAVSGLILPTKGEVTLEGKPPQASEHAIGLALKPDFWPGLTGLDNLTYLASIRHLASRDQIMQTMERVGLAPKDTRSVKAYSRGMLQKLNIAQAIMENQSLILLDEPCDSLDEESIRRFYPLMLEEKQRGATILIAYHADSEMDTLIDHRIVLSDGKAHMEV